MRPTSGSPLIQVASPPGPPRRRSNSGLRRSVPAAVLYVISSLQTLSVVEFGGMAIKPLQLITAIACIGLLAQGMRLAHPLRPVALYLGFVLTFTLLPYSVYGAKPLYLNYLFALVLLFLASAFFAGTTYEEGLRGLRWGALTIAAYSATNVLLQYDRVLASRAYDASSGARAQVENLLYGGGINVEASWIALASMFFVEKPKQFVIYSAPTVFVILAFSSRTATLVWGICAAVMLFRALRPSLAFLATLAIGSAFLFYQVQSSSDLSQLNVIQRFLETGNDPGSQGRVALWKGGFEAFLQHPFFGYGIGNEVDAIRGVTGLPVLEDNVHNLYLGNALALGLLGPIVFIICMALLWIRLSGRFSARGYLLVFLAAGFLEFRGADSVFYTVVALLGACVLSPKESD